MTHFSLSRLVAFALGAAALPPVAAWADVRVPDRVAPVKPHPVKPDSAKPDASKPDASKPDLAKCDEVVIRALQAALAGDFDKYLAELPADRKETAEQKSQLQRYEWKRFSTQASWYVADPQKVAPTITQRQQPAALKAKLFLKDIRNKDAMPRPIELSWKDGRWWVTANSL